MHWHPPPPRAVIIAAILLGWCAQTARADDFDGDDQGFYSGYHGPETAQKPRPFRQGGFNFGVILGGTATPSFAMTLGGKVGYYVLPGLEPGLDTSVTFGPDVHIQIDLLPYVRWIIWRGYPFAPFVKVQSGRIFLFDAPDMTPVGGGAGAVIFFTRNLGLQAEVLLFRLFPDSACGDSCLLTNFGLSFGMYL